MDGNLLGIVERGRLRRLTPTGSESRVRLTRIPMQAAQAPESAEIALDEYNDAAIMVRGHDGGAWIYSAAIVEKAGPILTAVVRRVFESGGAR